MKILTVLGARPQFIKAAALSRALVKLDNVEEIIIHTGQHYDSNMSDIFFEEMEIPKPKYLLATGGKHHGLMTGEQLIKIEEIIFKEKPDLLLVYGDTNSTLAGALAATKLHIPIAHVEAGLRSFNKKMPEEVNRILTDQISDYLFVPSDVSKSNLIREGVDINKIHNVGDIMYDVSLYYRKKFLKPIWFDSLQIDKFVLCTIHRAENTDNFIRLKNIIEGIGLSNKKIILPIHPRTLKRMQSFEIKLPDNVIAVDPIGYLEMGWLELHSDFIITDSGGVQKEAYFHGKYCITLREETEWIELVEHGFNNLVGFSKDKITEAINIDYPKFVKSNLYGYGNTSEKIIEVLLKNEKN